MILRGCIGVKKINRKLLREGEWAREVSTGKYKVGEEVVDRTKEKEEGNENWKEEESDR